MKAITARGFKANPEGGQTRVTVEVPIAELIVQNTENVPTFEELVKIQTLREKAKKAISENNSTPVELTDDEFYKFFAIVMARGVDEKIAIKDILESENPEFDIFSYEKKFLEKNRLVRRSAN